MGADPIIGLDHQNGEAVGALGFLEEYLGLGPRGSAFIDVALIGAAHEDEPKRYSPQIVVHGKLSVGRSGTCHEQLVPFKVGVGVSQSDGPSRSRGSAWGLVAAKADVA